jgi:hypothetical protein
MDSIEIHSDWYRGITEKVDLLNETISKQDYRRYKIDTLLCLAERVEQFSPECGQCQMFQQDMVTLVQDVSNLTQLPNKEARKQYFKSMNSITGHLQRQHKLVTEGYYTGICMAIGSGIGVAIGAGTDNVGSGIPIGVGLGVAVGAFLDYKARKEGRILCPRKAEVRTASRSTYVLVGVLVALLAVGILAFILFNRSS